MRVLQARKEYEAKVESVAAEIQRSVVAAQTAAAMLRFQQSEGLAQAQATVDGAQRRYEAGEESVLVLIQAQDSLVKRRGSYVNALRDYAAAIAELEGAIGGRSLGAVSPAGKPVSEPVVHEE